MDVHKPKAWRGGRELLKEIGIIVLGVLIALGAEQAAQAVDWANKARFAEDLMRAEIAGDDGPQVYLRIAGARCWTQLLENIRGLVEDGAARPLIVQRIKLLPAPVYTWDSAAYRAADSSGVLVHMPRERVSAFSQFYELMPGLDVHSVQEATSAAHLSALSAKGGAISEAERLGLLAAVEELSNENHWIRSSSLNAADAMHRAGVKLDKAGQSVFDTTLDPVRRRPDAAACLAAGLSDLRIATSGSQAPRYFLPADDQFNGPAGDKK